MMVTERQELEMVSLWGSTECDWAALFRVRTAHLNIEEGPRKGGLKIARFIFTG